MINKPDIYNYKTKNYDTKILRIEFVKIRTH